MKVVQNIILFLSILLFIGLVYISTFNVYQTDDYIFSYTTQKLGLVENIVDFYRGWGGRYFGYSINMLNPVAYDSREILPKIYPIFLLTSFIGVLVLNFKLFFKDSVTEALRKSFLFFFFYTVLLTSLSEHYFWITGSNIYFLPLILSLLLLFFLGKYQETQRSVFFYISCALVVFLMGSNEVLGFLLLGMLVVNYLYQKSFENKVLLLIGIVFLAVMIFAPGNFKRLHESESTFFIKSIKRIGVFGANTLYISIKTFLIIPLFVLLFEKDLQFLARNLKLRRALTIWCLSFIPLLFLAFILNTIARQFETIIIFFLVTGSIVMVVFYRRIKKLWWLSVVIIFLPATNLFPQKYSNFNFDYNLNAIVQEVFRTDLRNYNREITERISLIQKSTSDSLLLDRIRIVPKVLYFREMASEKEEETYVNDQLQKYFDKKYIRVKD